MIRFELEKSEIRAGEQLKGQAVWTSQGGKAPRKIEVTCRWRVEGKRKDRSEVVAHAAELNAGDRSQVTVPFDFEIPDLGPLSYQGKLFRIVWELVARVDLPWARDEVETLPVVVLPGEWSAEDWADQEEEEEPD